jgi:hypothetical protein
MSDIYEDTALQKGLSSIIFETQNSDIATETALSVLNGVDKVSISRKQRDALYVAA